MRDVKGRLHKVHKQWEIYPEALQKLSHQALCLEQESMPNSVTGEYRDTTSVDAGPPPSLQGKASREQGLLLLSNRRGPSNTEGLFPQHPAVQQVVSKSSVAPTGFPTHRPVTECLFR